MTTMYTIRDVEGIVMYVGVAENWPARMAKHQHYKEWWDEVHHIDLDYFVDRQCFREALSEGPLREVVVMSAERPCPRWCMCRYVVYDGDSIDRCVESFDDERGVARCHLGRSHHGGHEMTYSVLRWDWR